MVGVSLEVTDFLSIFGVVQFLEAVLTEEAGALGSQAVIVGDPCWPKDVTHTTLPPPAPMLAYQPGVVISVPAVSWMQHSRRQKGRCSILYSRTYIILYIIDNTSTFYCQQIAV